MKCNYQSVQGINPEKINLGKDQINPRQMQVETK